MDIDSRYFYPDPAEPGVLPVDAEQVTWPYLSVPGAGADLESLEADADLRALLGTDDKPFGRVEQSEPANQRNKG